MYQYYANNEFYKLITSGGVLDSGYDSSDFGDQY